MSKKLNYDQRYVYVLLTGTNTVLAKTIRIYTGEPFSHASISLDKELVELYSFARKQRFNPFNAGFVKEDIECGVFGADKNAHCGVYEIPVTEEEYEKIANMIAYFSEHRNDFGYNVKGLFAAAFDKEVADGKHFMCSQFVYHVFHANGISLFERGDGPVRPYHFHQKLTERQIYNGNLHKYRKDMKSEISVNSQLEGYAEAM